MLDSTSIAPCLPAPLRLAQSPAEIANACQLRKEEYSKLYPSVRVSADDPFHRHAYVVYSCDDDGEVRSTASFIVDSELGLPEDPLFPPEVSHYRKSRKRLMEIGRFVIRDKQSLVKQYYRAAYEVALRRGVDIILIVIRQQHIPLHLKLIGARLLAEDVGESFGSDYKFCCLAWPIQETKPEFFKWTASA